MTKKLWILTVASAMALPQIGTAQFGPKPGQPQQPGKPQPVIVVKPGQSQPGKPQPAPAVKPAPQPQTAPVVKPAAPQPAKPQPAVVVKPIVQPPAKPQPAVVVKPTAPQPPPKPQPPVVVKPAAPLPAPPKPAPAPVVVYRPGHKNHPLQPPKERDHYKDWKPLPHKKFYRSGEAPTMMQVSMRVGQEVEFKLEEKIGDGLQWFARCDASMVDVDVDHERTRWWFGRTSYSEVEIEARRPGNTIVELVYARPGEWDLGHDPQKVIQIFVHIE